MPAQNPRQPPPSPATIPALTAVIVAAGRSTRFGGPVKKPFLPLAGLPVFLHAVRAFAASPLTRRIVLVVAPEDVGDVRSRWAGEPAGFGIGQVVAGGAERTDSVEAALDVIPERADHLVAVHDGARPLVTTAAIEAVARVAAEYGAALAAEAATSTVKLARTTASADPHPSIDSTIPRDRVWLAQTPQIFRIDVLRGAMARRDRNSPATDDAELVERTGREVRLVAVPQPNFKVTTPSDFRLAEAWLAMLSQR